MVGNLKESRLIWLSPEGVKRNLEKAERAKGRTAEKGAHLDPLHIFLVLNVAVELIAIVQGATAIQAAIARQNEALRGISEAVAKVATMGDQTQRLIRQRIPPTEPQA